MARTVDEETPLLHDHQQKHGRTPLPWRQFTIILFLQLAEPLTSQLISPFAPQLIRDIGVTNGDETKVGFYVGLLHSLFFATQALTVLHWSRVSDHIGRKPVLLTGLFGLSLSMYCFGLSKTFIGLVLSRALNGALNGNIGVLKSMMVEITDETNLAQAYAYMPIAWSSGGTLGPLIGGFLSRPADRFPNVFGNVEFMREYPYFLACAIPATFTAIAWIVAFFFLKETLPNSVPFRELIVSKFRQWSNKKSLKSPEPSSETLITNENDENKPLPLRSLLIPRVLIAAANYAALSTIEISFRAVQPLFYATPIELGGLGLDPPQIGNILATYGILNGLFQIFCFADLHDRFGSKAIFTFAVSSGIPFVLICPLINALAREYGLNWAVWCMIGVQVLCSMSLNLGYSCIFIYIAAASPNRGSLGATNGIAQMLVSIMRSIGPASAASIFSLSIKTPGHAWFVYYFLLAVIFIAIGASLLLPRKMWKK
ncbi:major facilitator superfamily domain-containing protein [Pisolithus orientalis]|uniref:major facilitator superfamily domain-containing protein n=1 Tax=Pisolithus orientalis TaxID=936130 RepID=UPI0022245C27|nr:major facilitator superfamily domain-containing protein [Pisolithus orientalis]KAI6006602.1 major facilitator superfamily domain-containing protein [Pisolithus orientalis]